MLTKEQKVGIKQYIKDNFKVDVTRIALNKYITERDADNDIYEAYYKSSNKKTASSIIVKVSREKLQKGNKLEFVASSCLSNIKIDMAVLLKDKIYTTFKKIAHMSQDNEIEVEVRLNSIVSKNIYLEDLPKVFNPDVLYLVMYKHVPTQKMEDIHIDITENNNKVIYHMLNENSIVLQNNKDRIHSQFENKNEGLKFGVSAIMKHLIENDNSISEFKDILVEDFNYCDTVEQLLDLYDKQNTVYKMVTI